MPDKYGFDHLPNRGSIKMSCTECDFSGDPWIITEEVREKHYLKEHLKIEEVVETENVTSFLSRLKMTKRNCRICGKEFEQERKRGRPRVFCNVCNPPK